MDDICYPDAHEASRSHANFFAYTDNDFHAYADRDQLTHCDAHTNVYQHLNPDSDGYSNHYLNPNTYINVLSNTNRYPSVSASFAN